MTEIEELQKKYDELVEESNRKISSLQEQVFALNNELSHIKNSRLLKKAMTFREAVGSSRKGAKKAAHKVRRAPHDTLHKVRVIVAPAIPERVRKSIKYRYKAAKQQSHENKMQYSVVANTKVAANTPVITVVIPYFNREETLAETLDSLKKQTFQNFEVIIVDDGSTEKSSKEFLEKIAKENPDIKVIHQHNQGVAAARNNGIKEAKGRYVICLDSDDLLAETFIEKAIVVLDTNPEIDIFTTDVQTFGVVEGVTKKAGYDARHIIDDNMVITAAAFKKSAWEVAGGYKSNIGYEDWEYWINLAENGFWGKHIAEPLFKYRTAVESRYIEDKGKHWNNIQAIRSLHPRFRKEIKNFENSRRYKKAIIDKETAFLNLSNSADYTQSTFSEKILITVPWMTFGGAETLIYNFCSEIKGDFDISFITGLPSEHEWEYKFREISSKIYHLANLFEDPKLHLEFISNYIETRGITLLHVIHNGFMFEMLPELKKRHPKLKVLVTMFNDRVEYFEQSTKYAEYIDAFSSDNSKVEKHYLQLLPDAKVYRIPNGIDVDTKYSPSVHNQDAAREALGISPGEVACFYIGRLSPEKNPDVFVAAAKEILGTKEISQKIRFFVIGDGPMGKEVVEQIKSIKSENIEYLGYKAEVAEYLAAADIFVLPSAIEGFPLSLLEAMSMGVVSVASRVGAVDEIIEEGKTGYIIDPPGSVPATVKIIQKLVADTSLIDTLGKAARVEAVKKYSAKILGKKYATMYKEVSK